MKFEKQTYTQTPNSLFIEMKDMDECELKVVMLICRYTFGYHRDEVKLSTRRIADEIGMNTASVQKGAGRAIERGLIEKVIDGNKTTTWRALVSDSNSDTPAIQILTHRDSNSDTLSSVKESIKKEKKSLSKTQKDEVIKSANKAMDKILELNSTAGAKDYWKGRELIRPDLLVYADWYNGATNQVMTKRVQDAWWKALAEWKDEALSVEALQEAYKHKSEWSIVSDPNQLTKDAVAINRAILAKPLSPTVPIYNPTTDEEDYVPAPPRK